MSLKKLNTLSGKDTKMKGTILVVNGPNLNMLGVREVEKYGGKNLDAILAQLEEKAHGLDYKIKSFQSNSEGEMIDFIQLEGREAKGMLLNAGAYTHTSIAIRDAILSVKVPFVEIHLSNIFNREHFRSHSFLSDIALGIISGFGENSYYLGISALVDLIEKRS
jgi:3-dehydroquinate dehydratase-2